MSLFPELIPRILGVEVLAPVEYTQDGAKFALDADGRRWITKTESTSFSLVAEAISYLLAKDLAIDIPEAAVCPSDLNAQTPFWWCSRYVPYGKPWHDSFSSFVVNYDSVAATLALDVVTGNDDRHCENFLCCPDPDDHHIRAWTIDYGGADVGNVKALGQGSGLQTPKPHMEIPPLFPMSRIRESAREAAVKLAQIPRHTLSEYVRDACYIGGVKGETKALLDTLAWRVQNSEQMVTEYLVAMGRRES